MPLQQTSGAASYDAFGGGVSIVPKYIEDYFSTFLYEGNSSVGPIISNGIDLSTKGGLVWLKTRSAATGHVLFDSARGMSGAVDKFLQTQNTDAEIGSTNYITPSTNGFSLLPGVGGMSATATSYVSWAWAKAPKFFDVVTYTGNSTSTSSGNSQTIAHNLGSVPGTIIVKKFQNGASSDAEDWVVYHRSLGATQVIYLNRTNATATSATAWNNTEPTATNFTVGRGFDVNNNNSGYVAYLFAHNAGGFGLTGTDNVISCGSYTGNGSTSGPEINLGYEPQWILIKRASGGVGSWLVMDNMRGTPVTGNTQYLIANSSGAEGGFENFFALQATGFKLSSNDSEVNTSGSTYIYIAIRRGPMKVPTTGTSVFSPFTTAAATGTAVTTNFPVDFQLYKYRAGIDYFFDVDRLRGVNSTTTANATPWLDTTATTAETTATNVSRNWGNTGFEVPGIVGGASNVFYSFRRAPGFFDEVCYTGTGANRTVAHNLGVVPEMMIVRSRAGNNWIVYHVATGNNAVCILNLNNGVFNSQAAAWNTTTPTASVVSVGTSSGTNASGTTYVAYLFASCPGVSRVGSYTGNGTTQIINCGFTAGSRFVLIKRTDAAGDWYVWDSARGIVAGNDPYLLLNSTAAEVTLTDYVDTAATGFELSSTALATVNVSGGTYIFLAIA